MTDDGNSFRLAGAARDRIAHRLDVELRIQLRENGHLPRLGLAGENLCRLHRPYEGTGQDQVQPAAELPKSAGGLLEPAPALVGERSPLVGNAFATFDRDAVLHYIELHDVSCLGRKAHSLTASVIRNLLLASARLTGFQRSLRRDFGSPGL